MLFVKAAKAVALSIALLPLAGCAVGTGLIFASLLKSVSYAPDSEETLFRQEEIETKLLELEKAIREQDESKERESKEGINYEKIQNDTDYQYQIEKEKQIELLKTTPPSLTNYYKQKVSKYFNLLLNRPDL